MNKLLTVLILFGAAWSNFAQAQAQTQTQTQTQTQSMLMDAQPINVDFLIQWQSTQPIFQYWLAQKKIDRKSSVEVLVSSHSKATLSGRELQSLPINFHGKSNKNKSFISFAIEAFFSQRFSAAHIALQQVEQPVSNENQDVFSLISSLLAITDGKFGQAKQLLSNIENNSELYFMAQYNLGLVLVEQADYQQADLLFSKLEPLVASTKDRSLHLFVRFLQARVLGLNGNSDAALKILNQLASGDSQFMPALQLKSEILLANKMTEQALVSLLVLAGQQDQKLLNYHQVHLIESLSKLGAVRQAETLREQYIGKLLTFYKKQTQLVAGLTDSRYLNGLLNRTANSKNDNSFGQFSEDTQLIIDQIEKNNTLVSQLSDNLSSVEQYGDMLNKGLGHITEQFKTYRKELYRGNPNNPYSELFNDPQKIELERLLTELVGEPSPRELRYQLLDGLVTWSTGNKFQQRWWLEDKDEQAISTKLDLDAAKIALEAILAQPREANRSLLKQHITALQAQMSQAHQRAKSLIVELKTQKVLLAEQLKISLVNESSHILFDIEQQLLWLARGNQPANAGEPGEQTYYSYSLRKKLAPNNTDLLTVERDVDNTPPVALNNTLQVLNLLATSAQSTSIKDMSALLLADLQLTAAQNLNGDAKGLFRGIEADVSQAITLYQGLLEHNSTVIDQASLTYQLAKAYDFTGQLRQSLAVLERFSSLFSDHPWHNEVLFRAGELQFSLGDYDLAAQRYLALVNSGDKVFSERASYKLGWSYFKTGEYKTALPHFFKLVDTYWYSRQSSNKHHQRVLGDVLRIIAMTFANLDGVASVEQFFSNYPIKDYQESIYLDLARYYQRKQRYSDAAQTFESLVKLYPSSLYAPYYQSQVVKAYIDGGFPTKSWPAREKFVADYSGLSSYWLAAEQATRDKIKVNLSVYLQELAQLAHAKAQKSKLPADFITAIEMYQHFIRDINESPRLPQVLSLMAEAHVEINQHQLAANAFERAAYQFDDYDNKAQAGYRALLAYQQLYLDSSDEKPQILAQGVALAHRHLERFAVDKNTRFVQTKLAEDYLLQDQYQPAIRWANKLVVADNTLSKALQIRNWRVIAHANFAMTQFDQAELGYLKLLELNPEVAEVEIAKARLAQSIYKQGEQAQQAGNLALAVTHFKRVKNIVPDDKIVINAEFDAATVLMADKQWRAAISTLEQFMLDYPQHQLQKTIPEKLVIAFEQTENWGKAAQYLAMIFEREKGTQLGRDALWRTAKLYQKAQQPQQAYEQFKRFVATFPSPLNDAIEAREEMVKLSVQLKQVKSQRFWLKEIINTHDKAKDQATERSLYLASQSALAMGQQNKVELDGIKLKLPLKRSLGRKQKAMKNTLYYLNKAITYRLAQHSTQATLIVGDIYKALAKDLMNSPKPKQLNALELEQYEILLEEQAFPFEDKAIELYELNVSQIGDGIYTKWIEHSLNALRQIMPARYNKNEKVESYHETIQ